MKKAQIVIEFEYDPEEYTDAGDDEDVLIESLCSDFQCGLIDFELTDIKDVVLLDMEINED